MDDSEFKELSLFQTVTLTHAIDTMFTPKTFLLDQTIKDEVVDNVEFFQVDTEKGERDLAPFQHRGKSAKQVDSTGFKSKIVQGFNIRLKTITNAYKILSRSKGVSSYIAKSPAQKATEKAAMDLMKLKMMIIRSQEWIMSKMMQNGKVSINTPDFQGEIDLLMKASHKETLLTTARWSNAASEPLEDVDRWRDIVEQDSGKIVTEVYMDSHGAKLFRNNEKVLKQLDNRRVLSGEIVQKRLPSGARYMGMINEVDYYQYSEWYKDPETGIITPLLDRGRVILYSSQCQATKFYGSVDDLEFSGYSGDVKMFSKSWLEPDPSGQIVLAATNTLPYLHEIDGVFSALVDEAP